MREIKFRAWDAESKEMLSDVYDGMMIQMNNGQLGLYDDVGEFIELDYPLMQFTGLLDKNGREIYEGDIVTGWTAGKDVVKYDERNARFTPIWIQLWNDDIRDSMIEVIGNIYESPNLLENV